MNEDKQKVNKQVSKNWQQIKVLKKQGRGTESDRKSL